MGSSPWFRSLVFLLQACLLLSCGSSIRSVHPPTPGELPKLALVIQEGANGQVVHSWRPAAEFQKEMQNLPSSIRSSTLAGEIVLVSGRRRDCDQEQIDCHRNCMRRKLPAPLNYIPRGHPRHNQVCRDQCRLAYDDCMEAEKARALRFSAVEEAVGWLKEHRTELLVGTVVVIAGVTFVAVSAGAGLVVLAPFVVMASASSTNAPLCEGGAQ
ncbi:hypothetical protein [Archangium gephyra]|nr:hypothetical protein [Archangium gephyra]